jgi:hypothetical protein
MIPRLSLVILLGLIFGAPIAYAQTPTNTKTTPGKATVGAALNPLIQAAQEFKAKTEQLIQLQEKELLSAEAKTEELRQLVSEGLVAKAELAQREESLSVLRSKLEASKQQIENSEHLVAEIKATDEAQKMQLAAAKASAQAGRGQSFLRPTIMRYGGASSFALANLASVQGFFVSRFGRNLPTSAIGQSSTHNQLGYDHRNAVDVALHPDSLEGQTLINYLRSQGIPFLAFRGAVPGVATGAHIHIGSPSHRLS